MKKKKLLTAIGSNGGKVAVGVPYQLNYTNTGAKEIYHYTSHVVYEGKLMEAHKRGRESKNRQNSTPVSFSR